MERPVYTLENGVEFIGSYIYEQNKPFYTNNYFFVSSTDSDNPEGKISQVSTNGMTMNMKGYRAYFNIPGSTAQSLSVKFDDTNAIIPVVGEEMPSNVYTLSGQLVRRNARDLNGLPRGLYVMRGKLVVVK